MRCFAKTSCNLCVCKVKEQEEHHFVTTVAGKKLNCSNMDIHGATKAWELKEIVGFPSTQAFVKMVENNSIKSCPIT